MFFFLLSSPMCLARPSHESDRSGVLWPLYRYKDSIEVQGERERERENEPSTHHNTLSSALHFLPFPPPLVFFVFFFLNFLLLRVVVDPPPSWSYINVTNHNSARWETQDHLGPWLASWLWTSNSVLKRCRGNFSHNENDDGWFWIHGHFNNTNLHTHSSGGSSTPATITDINEQPLLNGFHMV